MLLKLYIYLFSFLIWKMDLEDNDAIADLKLIILLNIWGNYILTLPTITIILIYLLSKPYHIINAHDTVKRRGIDTCNNFVLN